MRKWLYRIARILGDVNSVRTGKVHRRVANKVLGRVVVKRIWR